MQIHIFQVSYVKCTEWIIRINFWTTSFSLKSIGYITGLCMICSLKKECLACNKVLRNLSGSIWQRSQEIWATWSFTQMFVCSKVLKRWTTAMWDEYDHHRCKSHGNANLATEILYGDFIGQSHLSRKLYCYTVRNKNLYRKLHRSHRQVDIYSENAMM